MLKLDKSSKKLIKAVILGDMGVGKTELFTKLIGEKEIDRTNISPVEVARMDTIGVKNVEVLLWDYNGVGLRDRLLELYIKGSRIIILVFDLSSFETLDNVVQFWASNVEKYANDQTFIILVGNKSDNRKISERRLNESLDLLRRRINVHAFIETSAKFNTNIAKLLDTIKEIAEILSG